MKTSLLIGGLAGALLIGIAVPSLAQNGSPRIAQQAQGPLARSVQMQAPQIEVQQAQAPAAPAAPPAAVAPPPVNKLPDTTFEQLIGDEVVRRNRISPIAVGVGAIAGVIAFNVASSYFAPATMMVGGPLVGTAIGETAIAASRVYAITSAVIGGLVANWIVQDLTVP